MDSLTIYARDAFKTLRCDGDKPGEWAANVAVAVACYARRHALPWGDVSNWLQCSYGAVFVKETALKPGVDMSDLRDIMSDVYHNTKPRSAAFRRWIQPVIL